MIANDHELQVTLDRIARFQAQVAHLRQVEVQPANYHATHPLSSFPFPMRDVCLARSLTSISWTYHAPSLISW